MGRAARRKGSKAVRVKPGQKDIQFCAGFMGLFALPASG
jgi:hypothetical protein